MTTKNNIDYAFIADLDTSGVLKALAEIDKRTDVLEKSLDAKFKKIADNSKNSFSTLEKSARSALKTINSEFATLTAQLSKLGGTTPKVASPGNQLSQDETALRIQQEETRLQQAQIQLQSQELALQNKIIAAKQQGLIAAQATLQSEISRYPQLQQQLGQLAQKYGNFTAVLGRNRSELNNEEKEVLDLIRKHPQLANTVDKLTKEYGELNLQIKKTTPGLKKGGAGALGFASKLGLITSASFLVTSALRNMASRAKQVFKAIIKNSVSTAQQFDLVKISIRGILGTDDIGKVERLFRTIRKSSRGLGTNVASIANAFLPLLDNVDQLEQVGESVQELIQLSIVGGKRQTQGDAIRAIAEGFSGDFISIRRLFELTPGEIGKIRDTYRDLGTKGFLDALDEVLTARGISLEEFSNTTIFQFNKLREGARDLQAALGAPIDEKLTAVLTGINDFIIENLDDLLALGEAIGSLIAELTGNVGETLVDSLNDLSFDNLFESFREFEDFLANIKEFADVFKSLFKFIGKLGEGDTALAKANWLDLLLILTNVGFALEVISLGIAGLPISELLSLENLNDSWETFIRMILIAAGRIDGFIAGVIEGFKTLDDQLTGKINSEEAERRVAIAREEAFNKTIQDGVERYLTQTDAIKDRNAAIEENRSGQGATFSEKDRLEFILGKIPEQLKTAGDKIAAAQAKIDERSLKVATRISRKKLDIAKDQMEKKIDIAIKFSRERENLELKHLRRLEDLENKRAKDRRDIFTDFTDTQAEINQKADDKLVESERDSTNKRIEIERKLQQRLAEMRREFLFEAEEAIRQNDAVAFLRLQRKHEFELNEAKIKAQTERENAVDEEKIKRQEIDTERQTQLANAKADRDQDLADLQTKLSDELEKIRLTRRRALEDQRISEKRRYADLKTSFDRQHEAFNEFVAQKREDLLRANGAELEIIAQAKIDILAIEQSAFDARLKLVAAFAQDLLGINRKIKQSQQWLATSGYGSVGNSSITTDDNDTPDGSKAGGGRATDAEKIALSIRKLAVKKGKLTGELEQQIINLVQNNAVNDLLALFKRINEESGSGTRGMATGGAIRANETVVVGDGGEPELFTPDRSGFITPFSDISDLLSPYLRSNNQNFYLPPPTTSNIDQSRNYQVDLQMLDPTTLSPGQIAIVAEIVKRVLLEAT